jgi:hypothetical protein
MRKDYSMRIVLNKHFILQLYVLTREAERSIHAALSSEWSELRAGYPPNKIEAIRRMREEILREVDLKNVDRPRCLETEYRLADASPNPFRWIFRSWLWKRARFFRFGEEIVPICDTLDAVATMVASETRPENSALIALRVRLYFVERGIQFRCCAITDLTETRNTWEVQPRKWLKKVG